MRIAAFGESSRICPTARDNCRKACAARQQKRQKMAVLRG